jgi:hypothetical protein
VKQQNICHSHSSRIAKSGLVLFALAVTSHADKLQSRPNRVSVTHHRNNSSPTATFTEGNFQTTRHLHDQNRDGWCDLWCSLFPNNPKIYDRDSDGDGMTDYEEMVIFQDPNIANPLPRHLTAQEKAQAMRVQKAKRQKHGEKLREKHHEQILKGSQNLLDFRRIKRSPLPKRGQVTKNATHFARTLKEVSEAEKSAAHSQKSGVRLKKFSEPNTYDSYTALLTKADHLWPGGSFPFHDATGADPVFADPEITDPIAPIGIWDEGGLGLPTPAGFTGRVFYGESLPFKFHTFSMAQIIGLASQDSANRGLAYGAKLKFYDDTDPFTEMAAEAAGLVDGQPVPKMLFSNHSYSQPAGWDEFDGGQNGFIHWRGPKYLVGEDPEFGAYTWRSKRIDAIIYQAQTYLPIFSAGNDANDQVPNGHGSPGFQYVVGKKDVDPTDPANLSTLAHPRDAGNADPDPNTPTPWEVNPYLGFEFSKIHGEETVLGLGLDTIKSTGSAKNNLTVGAVYGARDGEDLPNLIGLSDFSSRGPVDDGRIKPDIVAPATFQDPPDENFIGGGTSQATAAITGTYALLNEINHDNGGPTRLASTWKALLLNTAIDCTDLKYLDEPDNGLLEPYRAHEWDRVFLSYMGPSADAANLIGPDYFFGWGLVDAEAAADLLIKDLRSGSGAAHLQEHYLCDLSNDSLDSNNVEIEIPIEHDGTSTEIRVMICWTDPPYQDNHQSEPIDVGAVDADPADPDPLPGPGQGITYVEDSTPRLINDLDLKIIAPDGSEHLPWVLDRTNPLDPASRNVNNLDNVEQVVISAPVPGTYTVVVTHKGTLKNWLPVSGTPDSYQLVAGGEQAFSIAMNGNLGPTPAGPVLEITPPVPQSSNFDWITLTVTGFTGVPYIVEASNTLETDDWSELTPHGHQGSEIILTSDQPTEFTFLLTPSPSRFFRVREMLPPTE